MTTTCSLCEKSITGREINYTADARVVCEACLDRPPPMVGGTGYIREYEFDASENEVVRTLANPMGFVGVISVVFGVLNGILGLIAIATLQGALTLAEGVALCAIGGWLAVAAGAFKDIVKTEGADMSNLMIALRKLRNVYTLQAWLLGIACCLVIVLVVRAVSHA